MHAAIGLADDVDAAGESVGATAVESVDGLRGCYGLNCYSLNCIGNGLTVVFQDEVVECSPVAVRTFCYDTDDSLVDAVGVEAESPVLRNAALATDADVLLSNALAGLGEEVYAVYAI